MKLSAPVHVLRDRAKKLKTEQSLTLVAAQNQIAQQEGFVSWSQLIARQKDLLPDDVDALIDYVHPGDLVLLGARPQIGKVSLAVALIVSAMRRDGPPSHFFTLVERQEVVTSKLDRLLEPSESYADKIVIDTSEDLHAERIMEKLKPYVLQDALIVVDYLQMLDERRVNPPLQNQLESLSLFAKETGCTILFITQLSRSVDDKPELPPSERDVRLPNPLDLGLFNKIMFLYKDERQLGASEAARLCIRKPHVHELSVTKAEIGLA